MSDIGVLGQRSAGAGINSVRSFRGDILATTLWAFPGKGRVGSTTPDLTPSHIAYLLLAVTLGQPIHAAETAKACIDLRLDDPTAAPGSTVAGVRIGANLAETVAWLIEDLMYASRRKVVLAAEPTITVRTAPAITDAELTISEGERKHRFAFRANRRTKHRPPILKYTVLTSELVDDAAAILLKRLTGTSRRLNLPAEGTPSSAGGSAPPKAGRPKQPKGAAPWYGAAPQFGCPSATSSPPTTKRASTATRHQGTSQCRESPTCRLEPTEHSGSKPTFASRTGPEVIRVTVSADANPESSHDVATPNCQHRLVLD